MKSLQEIVTNNELAAEKELQRRRLSSAAKSATTVTWRELNEVVFEPAKAAKVAAKARKARQGEGV